jgi:hypothetical protein
MKVIASGGGSVIRTDSRAGGRPSCPRSSTGATRHSNAAAGNAVSSAKLCACKPGNRSVAWSQLCPTAVV